MRYNIGIDLGIASVGYAVMRLDDNDEPCEVIRLGSRIFNVAENPKDGASLALPRREARGMRRRLRRKAHRKERLRNLLVSQGILSKEELKNLYKGTLTDIYELRKAALDRTLTNKELARVLLHIAERRGFRSNRKATTSKEDGELLKAIDANRTIMNEKGYRTVGEMLYLDEAYSDTKRNKGENYKNTVTRDMIEDEVIKIFEAQRNSGNNMCSPDFENAYLTILLAQRSFDEGPGGNSSYSGGIEKMVGDCTFEENEKRAPKASYSFEYFDLLQKINHIKLDNNGKTLSISNDQRNKMVELLHKSPNKNFADIRKELKLPDTVRFNFVKYEYGKSIEESEKAAKLKHLKYYHEMRKAFDKIGKGRIKDISIADRNEIARIFTLHKNEDKLRAELQNAGIGCFDIETLIDNLGSFSKFGHLSVKALDKIIPYLEQGLKYNEACEKAGYYFRGHNHENNSRIVSLKHLADEAENKITSPVVKRAISQCAKVINAIIREIGTSPVFINIELAREMSKDFKDRKDAEKTMEENRAYNDRIKDELIETDKQVNPTGLDIVKLKLWKQQDGRCLYSLDPIPREYLFRPGIADIDHIIPYSISFDDSYKNKVLVKTEENRQKGNLLPLQYLIGKKRDDFIVWVNNSNLPLNKKRFLLKKEITPEDEEGFRERNLQDTKTMSVFLYNYLNDNLAFAPFLTNKKRHVVAVNGSITSMLRKRWGLSKFREDGDAHHAIDAAVIACTTQCDIKQLTMIDKVSQFYRAHEQRYITIDGKEHKVDKKTGELKEMFPRPFDTFNHDVIAKSREVFVSRMPSRKTSGAAHKETIKGASENGLLKKVALSELKLDKNTAEIVDYYNPQDDRLLYDALKAQLSKYDGDAKKAFSEPFYKPKSDGSRGPLVKKVKITEKATLSVPVHAGTGRANNGEMVRVDVFHIEDDGYYLVPIYTADTVKSKLPNKAIVANKPYKEWKEVRDEDFTFSLYPNDLIRIKPKAPMQFRKVNKKSVLPETVEKEETFVYYKGASISTGAITVINHDNSYMISSLGTKTLKAFEKHQVDVLGNVSKVGKEKRQEFAAKGR